LLKWRHDWVHDAPGNYAVLRAVMRAVFVTWPRCFSCVIVSLAPVFAKAAWLGVMERVMGVWVVGGRLSHQMGLLCSKEGAEVIL
jgi:hypothetical protein